MTVFIPLGDPQRALRNLAVVIAGVVVSVCETLVSPYETG